ncbi:hypothetical protein D1007_18602 [Hordeum vulgare]|nr:hypothetical protein D1007_18602 [Hordeum vulgare]
MGRTCVYVHHVDKDAFLKGNIDPDPDELDMVFDLCPSYGELLEQVRKDLNWMDPSDVVEFDGRHNVGFGMHIRWKTMRVNSEQRWLAYKDTVAESLDKALELFAIKTNVPNLLDLNRVASSIVEAIPATINKEANIEPLSCVYEANEEVNIEHQPLVEANDEHDDDENDGNVLHDNNLGDLDKYNLQETMDHSIPYSRGYASESDDEGPDEEVDEEGFTAKEAEAFTNVLKRDHRTPLFEDLSLADEAVVDGGEGILFGVRPPSHRDTHGKNIILPGSKGSGGDRGRGAASGRGGIGRGGARGRGGIGGDAARGSGGIGGGLTRIGMAASQPNKAKAEWGEEKDAASEEQLLMERAPRKLREEDAAEARKKKDEEHKAKMDEDWQMFLENKRYEARIKENDRKTLEKRKKEYEANFKKMWAEAAAKREREHQRFTERVKEEASKMRKREEEEEEERKKKKGKGPCSTQ